LEEAFFLTDNAMKYIYSFSLVGFTSQESLGSTETTTELITTTVVCILTEGTSWMQQTRVHQCERLSGGIVVEGDSRFCSIELFSSNKIACQYEHVASAGS
jgi:hypothetical protein